MGFVPLLAGCGSHFELRRIEPARTLPGSVQEPDPKRVEGEIGVAIDFLTPTRGFMAMRDGELRRTDDGGRNWGTVSTGARLVSLSFVSTSHGFALTARGQVAATRDGGRSWTILHSFGRPSEDGPFPGAIEFVDPRDGWAAPSGYVYRTGDGGATWSRQRFQCGFALGGFSFVDATTGLMICGGQPATIEQEKELYATTDGGNTWRRRACVHVFGPRCAGNLASSGYASGLAFRNARTGLLITDRGGIARTLDGGVHWRLSLFTDDAYSIVSTSWASGRTIYALALQDGTLIRSDDAGRHWRRVNPSSVGPPTGAFSFSSPTRGIGISAGGLLRPAGIVATADGGASWREIAKIRLLDSQLVRTGRSIWAVAARDLPNGSARYFLVRSTDGGHQWRDMPTPPGLDVPTVSFPSAPIGYLADVSKRLFRTDDGGRSWQLVRKARRSLGGAVFVSSSQALLAGDFGLLRSDDGGRSWRRVRVTPRMRFNALAVLDARHWWLDGFTCPNAGRTIGPKLPGLGFAKRAPCGGKSYLLRTVDGGRTWTAIRFRGPPPSTLSFVTQNVGYAWDVAGGLDRTTDGGRTWRIVYPRRSSGCRSSQLRLSVQTQGTATQAAIFLSLRNVGRQACVISGRASVEIVRVGRRPRIAGNPVSAGVHVKLEPGEERVVLRAWWANWCGARQGFGLVARFGGRKARSGFHTLPACLSGGQTSTLAVAR